MCGTAQLVPIRFDGWVKAQWLALWIQYWVAHWYLWDFGVPGSLLASNSWSNLLIIGIYLLPVHGDMFYSLCKSAVSPLLTHWRYCSLNGMVSDQANYVGKHYIWSLYTYVHRCYSGIRSLPYTPLPDTRLPGMHHNCHSCQGRLKIINTLRPRQMDAISQTTFSNAFSWMKMHEFRFRFHWSLFLRFELTIFQHWFR